MLNIMAANIVFEFYISKAVASLKKEENGSLSYNKNMSSILIFPAFKILEIDFINIGPHW